ncbi:M61 family metallopeptidase [Pseudoalteromonas luteoviolacea]|uniref:M61 family metallopeptidase n=1 Tax=Pseudoalteromonas luteoviolacea TaxID=43657 RepID=UPI001154DD49|nr:PDZ domain-containing protein [Pseudoalteromonas luteoviolacea]TQF67403.1 M61 family metallopeptidase [Pseudoalteromonas luteoviolacea]
MKTKLSLLTLALVSHFSMADVQYRLSITEPEHHLGNVDVTFPKSAQAHIDVQLPDWRTGRYEILNMANGIRFFNANDSQGNALKWHKIDKNTWRVHFEKPTEVTVSYQVYANELGMRSRHIDDSHAFIDASGFFMFSDSFRQEPVRVDLNVPKQWRSVSGMAFAESKHSFKADNYDILLDSPIETGVNELHKFSVDGRDYELVIWGEGNYDVDLMLRDLKKLVKTGSLIWHDYPYDRYVFMVHATSGARGATEHLNSTIIQRHRDRFASRSDYIGFISTAAHEFIHTWNVKNYRPSGLVPYDYVDINYSDLLWLVEGSTSYLEDYLLLSAGITTNREFYNSLTRTVNRHMKTPGREVQSVAHTSFDKWINQGGDHGKNYSTNIYLEGALVSMALDIDLIDKSGGKVSYRDVHTELYKQHKLPKSFDAADVKRILKEISGRDYSNWWANYVDGPAILDFDALFEKVGLEYVYPMGTKEIARLDGAAKSVGELLELTHVARDGNAWKAGLTAGDKIVAVNKHQVRKDLAATLSLFEAGDVVTIDFIRRHKLMSLELKLAKGYNSNKVIRAVQAPSERQAKLYKAWTGVSHPNAKN